ncbi:hypothetical protein H4696_000539 [Amycolatopsis lexingtonensis]|uniref:Uncharacterized protein n=1 Tax=Amycolatopsis lexingtonensis TaxID=218822 RepID=A0ABR9HR89_9PSEU|nr:hypothetical protein [Amycolatopsis lexingtonensis]MBE1493439.1 hypothetical protein [Amycolatopsis lexingtonensis]
MTTTTAAPARRTSTAVVVAAWAVPVMVLGQFAFLTAIPIAVVLVGALRARNSLRWWAFGLAAGYAALIGAWLLGPSSAPSLSKFLSPVATGVFAAAGAAVAIAAVVSRRRGR